MSIKEKFYRIYWHREFNWKEYAILYNRYCKKSKNYYTLSSVALMSSTNLKENFVVIDLGCGTGAFTATLLKKFPKIKIIAIDISEDMIEIYKENFKKQIAKRQIKVVKGNAEQIQNYVEQKIDIIFIPSSLWDMNLESLFKNIKKIMKPKTQIIANVPDPITGKNKGFIYRLEKFFKLETGSKKKYRRIYIKDLKKILSENNLKIKNQEIYSFQLPKSTIKEFFKVLRYRYPHIFFTKDISYEERYKITENNFKKILETMPLKGLKESGKIIKITNNK